MLITAHGGAFGTGRNSLAFFDKIASYNVDVIEVDVQKCKDTLYIAHTPRLDYKKCLPLSYAFEFIKNHGFKINCDVKRRFIVKDVMALAKEKGVADRIIFTGSVCSCDIPFLSEAEVYLNKGFFKGVRPKPSNANLLKEYIDGYNCPALKGVNLRHTFATDDFLAECKKIGLNVSVFVADEIECQNRLARHGELANITTNFPDRLLDILQRNINK